MKRSRSRTASPTSRKRSQRDRGLPLDRTNDAAVLYEDKDMLAIDKPAGWLVTTPKWSRTKQNLQREIELALMRHHPWYARRQIRFLRFVHRLDRETSGTLLFAKHKEALNRLSRAFANHQVHKCYLCVVTGQPTVSSWTTTAPLLSRQGKPPQTIVNQRHGQAAITHFRLLRTKGPRSLLVACPVTGRTHQIRVHLAAAGHAICGDPLYATSKQLAAEPSGTNASPLALRSWGLELKHPFRKGSVTIASAHTTFLNENGFTDAEEAIDDARNWVRNVRKTGTEHETATGQLPEPIT